MKLKDLHEEFINVINSKIPKKADLVNIIADTLIIEKDAAYRRLSGKVNFSVREIGIIAARLNISIDHLMRRNKEYIWLPLVLEHPLKMQSMEQFYTMIDLYIEQMERIIHLPTESGNIYHTLPIEFYIHSPELTRFFFFRWGHCFVGTSEFNNYSTWELPQRAVELLERYESMYNFDNKIYYIWDESLIWLHCTEVANMCKMGVMGVKDKNEIRLAFKDFLIRLEQAIGGVHVPTIPFNIETTSFYASSMHLGFTCNYFSSGEDKYFAALQNIFSFSWVDDNHETFLRFKEWVDSFKGISTLLSHCGRIERKIFFDNQRKLVDYILDK